MRNMKNLLRISALLDKLQETYRQVCAASNQTVVNLQLASRLYHPVAAITSTEL